MKILVLYPYPLEPDGQSLQGHYLVRGLEELDHHVLSCDREDSLQKLWSYKHFKPDVAIGIGFWGDTPELIDDPKKHKVVPVPWFNADGWVANYHDKLNSLPLVLATSNWVKSTYERDGVKGDHVQVAPIGYDPSVFYPLPLEDGGVKKLREMIGIKSDEKMILTIGGDVTSKGSQEMIKAMAQVDKKFKKWRYVMKVWDSPSSDVHGEEERKLISELGVDESKFIYLEGKYSPEFIAKLLNACDVYAAPSRLEGFGMIQLEAQACGKPVISINAGGPRDTVIHGKSGFLADVSYEVKLEKEWVYPRMGFDKRKLIEFPIPKTFAYRADVDQLADFTLRLFTDDKLRKKVGDYGAKHALNNFNYKVAAKRVTDLINKHILSENVREHSKGNLLKTALLKKKTSDKFSKLD